MYQQIKALPVDLSLVPSPHKPGLGMMADMWNPT